MERNWLVMSKFFVHKTSFIDKSASIKNGTKIWHFCNIMSNSSIGENCILGQNVFVGQNVIIGDNTKIQNNVSLYDGLICEEEVFIGPSVVFTNVINPRSFIERKNEFKKTFLLKGCSIGANATIICGNKIGKHSLIGAGSVVNRDVKDFELVVGNPIRHIGWVDIEGNRLRFDNQDKISVKGRTYELNNNKVTLLK